jgi:ribose transport system substrate-binding protein
MELINRSAAERACAAHCYAEPARKTAKHHAHQDHLSPPPQSIPATKMRSSPQAYRLAVFTKNRSNPAYVGARLGADRLAERLGCSVTHYVPEEPDAVEEQRALLARAIDERADAIVLAPTHATALNAVLSGLKARGIPLLCFISRPQTVEPTCFVGSDDRELARGIADYLFDRLGPEAGVVTIEGHANALTTAARAAGFRDAAAARAGIHIMGSRGGDFQFDRGRSAMIALLEAHGQIDGVLAANDVMALGAIDVMRLRRRASPIVAINATPDGIKAIKRGELLASAAFDAMTLSCLAVEAAVRVLRGEAVPAALTLAVEIVDRSNCEAWNLPYEARSLPQWHHYVQR